MTDRITDAMKDVPEADFVEQTVPAYDDGGYPADDFDADTETPPEPERTWEANEADVIEQSIPVPLDDDYEDTDSDSEY
ncbi:hypothetical protein IU501_32445 [Nocardia otitidiscaviarum]|uniref:Uncharacterized protein n=1 Tax=Nocardia otitidiscaviarum TaxID=1823 RepID=A0A378Y8R8_9NOCA|nr:MULTISPECIES: hypothetical protein [Nocardia]MBF6137687.1 hypothetical protein [Nocardia otitidiscaviarum]MBF6183039.1 hypothetical protein [Nocardia otitidiscaviarum]MBF6488595.1 hypothetical protein [Nocardia otitidiscaviarum]MCP9622646.1 hypothetical protein [Nocardia otitidiscaviarum]QDP77394.1 hypothetical protein FOH10_00210 [Nocardia otitidiscaviarum]